MREDVKDVSVKLSGEILRKLSKMNEENGSPFSFLIMKAVDAYYMHKAVPEPTSAPIVRIKRTQPGICSKCGSEALPYAPYICRKCKSKHAKKYYKKYYRRIKRKRVLAQAGLL
jgi:ribosomal protein L40E